MSKKTATRSAQHVSVAEFTFSYNDTMVDTAGVEKNFGSSDLAIAVDAINLPRGSVVVGGEWVTETAFDTAGYDVIVGDSSDTDRYLASADLKAAGRTALTPTGFRNVDGLNIRVTIASDDVCTAGKATLRVEYIIADRACEVIPN